VNLTQRLLGGTSVPVPTQTSSQARGEIDLSGLSPGQFTLNVSTPGLAPDRREELDLEGNSQTDLSESPNNPRIHGIVHLENGDRASEPMNVVFSSKTGGERFSVRSSSDGEFEITDGGATPGKYSIAVFSSGQKLVSSLSATGAKVTGHAVEIAAGSSAHLDIKVSQAGGRVDGTAQFQGKSFAGALIVLVPKDIENNSTLVRRDQSDSDGTFSLFNVLPGTYTVVAIQNGWDLEWMTPAVLQPYLKAGTVIEVRPHARSQITVAVQ
jgi:hypothetical protein